MVLVLLNINFINLISFRQCIEAEPLASTASRKPLCYESDYITKEYLIESISVAEVEITSVLRLAQTSVSPCRSSSLRAGTAHDRLALDVSATVINPGPPGAGARQAGRGTRCSSGRVCRESNARNCACLRVPN